MFFLTKCSPLQGFYTYKWWSWLSCVELLLAVLKYALFVCAHPARNGLGLCLTQHLGGFHLSSMQNTLVYRAEQIPWAWQTHMWFPGWALLASWGSTCLVSYIDGDQGQQCIANQIQMSSSSKSECWCSMCNIWFLFSSSLHRASKMWKHLPRVKILCKR